MVKIRIVIMVLLISFFYLCLNSCTKEKSTDKTGKIKFKVDLKEKSSLKSLTGASFIVVTIKDSKGNSIYSSQKLKIYNFSDGYFSEVISLPVGGYDLTEFLVLDNNSNVIYATPVEGSSKAYLVSDPLSIHFSIQEDKVSELAPEVVSSVGSTPSDFGYATFSFNEISTIPVLLCISAYNQTTKNIELTDATLVISDGSNDLYTFPLTAKVNYIVIKDGLSSYTLKVTKANYESYSRSFTADELKASYQKPISILLSDLSSLIAFYPFNGNANDASGNGNNGTVNGASLTSDRFGNINSAYSFNGSSNYIEVPDKSSLRLGNTDYTISVWVKEFTRAQGQHAIISKRTVNGQNGYILNIEGLIHTTPGLCNFTLSGGSDPNEYSSSLITLNRWELITLTYVASTQTLSYYINGNLDASKGGIPSPNSTITTNLRIGSDCNIPGATDNYYFNGIIDDLKIYKRALSAQEISLLFNSQN